MTLGKKPFENIVRKGENAGHQPFLYFPQCSQKLYLIKIVQIQDFFFCERIEHVMSLKSFLFHKQNFIGENAALDSVF